MWLAEWRMVSTGNCSDDTVVLLRMRIARTPAKGQRGTTLLRPPMTGGALFVRFRGTSGGHTDSSNPREENPPARNPFRPLLGSGFPSVYVPVALSAHGAASLSHGPRPNRQPRSTRLRRRITPQYRAAGAPVSSGGPADGAGYFKTEPSMPMRPSSLRLLPPSSSAW